MKLRRAVLGVACAALVGAGACTALTGVDGLEESAGCGGNCSEAGGLNEGGMAADADASRVDVTEMDVLDASPDRGLDAACTPDPTTDPNNCGACGHSCLGGGCAGGACTPFAILSGFGMPKNLTADALNLYWTDTDGGTVGTCPIAGCSGHVTTLASGQATPYGIAASAGTVYWVNQGDGTLRACPASGGSVTTLATGLANPTAVVANAGQLFWTNNGDGTVASCAGMTCASSALTLATGQTGVWGIALDTKDVYWTAINDGTISGCSFSSCANGTHGTLASGQSAPVRVASDGTHLYWLDRGMGGSGGNVMGCPLPGCASTTVLTSGAGTVSFIAVDGSGVYWTESVLGNVNRCALVDCAGGARILAAGPPGARGLVLTSNAIYWANDTSGQIFELAK